MCDYCKKMKSLYYEDYAVIQEIYIESDGTMTISPSGGFDVNIEIAFCPMCGKKLD